jgi:hypothetical protein
MEDI